MSVRDVEKLVKNLGKEKPEAKEKNPRETAIFDELEEKMKAALGTKVSINRKSDKKGKIEIEYYSMEELERLMEIIMSH
jgi:ParB family chromosome partitioning protein